ncbi:excalibur calcium-binding domain-containing protein [Rhodococcus opacus]|uniref:excalibur calcium-binding domain-containing protein n=1 Tax=Rhodococcus opacus TaxID=37919 RepID=UPI00358FED5D
MTCRGRRLSSRRGGAPSGPRSARSPLRPRSAECRARLHRAVRGSGGCDTSAYYSKCADARAAGAAPLDVPGYRSELDRDDGGVACE